MKASSSAADGFGKHQETLMSLNAELNKEIELYRQVHQPSSGVSLFRSASEGLIGSKSTGDSPNSRSQKSRDSSPEKLKIASLRSPKPVAKPPSPSTTRSTYKFGSLLNESPVVQTKFSGRSGMVVAGAQVVSCRGQAWMQGVRPGWTITSLGGKAITPDEDDDQVASRFLDEAGSSKRRYEVIFQRGRAKFGSGVTNADSAGKEKEDNSDRLIRTFRYQGEIERSEHRAITYSQLERVASYATDHCGKWKDEAPPSVSEHSGKKLKMEIFNFHHTRDWIVKPATERRSCSFVELLTKQKQTPKFCVLHWWGAPLANFMKCLRLHFTVRGMTVDTPYWMAAFALREQDLYEEICIDKRQTSFYKAYHLSGGQALFVFGMTATAFRRIWCAYEASMCLGSPFDLAVCHGVKAQLLTNGLTAQEESMEAQSVGSGIAAKTAREKDFPLSVIENGMEIEIEKAEASNADDRARILNSIVGQALDSEPCEGHPLYAEADKKLHGHFAAHLLLRAALSENANSDAGHDLWRRIIIAIQGDVWRKAINWKLDGMSSAGMELLLQCFPPAMEDLTLRMRVSGVTDDDMVELANTLARHPGMRAEHAQRSIKIDLKDSDEVGDGVGDDVWKEAFEAVRELGVTLNLDFTELDSQGEQSLLMKAMGQALQVNAVEPGPHLKRYKRRVVPAVPALCRILAEDDRTSARKAAAKSLGALGQRAMDAVPALQFAQANDEQDSVKNAATLAIAELTGAALQME